MNQIQDNQTLRSFLYKIFNHRQQLAYYLFITAFLLFLTPTICHVSDRDCWIGWAKFQFEFGLKDTYRGWSDYLPLYHYILNIYAHLEGNLQDVELDINRLKYLTVFFELLSTLILYFLLNRHFKDQFKAFVFSLAYFLNFGVMFNSVIWGQVDGIMTFFVFASIITAFYKRPIPAMLCFVLALNMKLQAIFFLPLLMFVLALNFEKVVWRKWLVGIILAVLLQFLIISPFIFNGDFDRMMAVVYGSKGKFPVVSMMAYNLWFIILNGDPGSTQDTTIAYGLSYNQWGLIFFLSSSALVLISPFLRVLRYFFRGINSGTSLNEVLLIGTLIPLFFFFFNTQMHERYSHPAFIFLAAYSLINKKVYLLLIGSLAYFLNMEDAAQLLSYSNYGTLIFTPWFIASLYALIMIFLLYDCVKLQYPDTIKKSLIDGKNEQGAILAKTATERLQIKIRKIIKTLTGITQNKLQNGN
ncbi:MAG: hypothetical protein RL264_799 [Bacteroidota bacterium]